MDKYQKALAKAQEFLLKNKRDEAHDLKHHERVWQNCLEIIKREKLKINQNLLKIAAYWHDVVISEPKWPSKLNVQETLNYLLKELPKLGFSTKETKSVITAIKYHEFRDSPKNLEGLILQDADKLDALSKERADQMLESYKRGTTNKEIMESYMRTFLKWLPILSTTFHFTYSKRTADQQVHAFWQNSQWQQIYKDYKLEKEYQKSKAQMNSSKTQLLKTLITMRNLFNHLRLKINL
jgi:hypothetical protein